jgi:hypothetical protein
VRIFSDAAQPPREWIIDIDLDVLTRVQESPLACNLLAILDDDDDIAKRFARDPVFAGELLWQVVAPIAAGRNINQGDFRRSLRGDAYQAACQALVYGCCDFFASQQRDALLRIVEIKKEISDQLTAQIRSDAEAIDPKLMAEAFVESLQKLGGAARNADPQAIGDAVRESLRMKQSASPGSLPDGSESIPAGSPLASSD